MIVSGLEEEAALARFVFGREREAARRAHAVALYDAARKLTKDPETRGVLTEPQLRQVCRRIAEEVLDEIELMRHVRGPEIVP